MSPSGLLFPNPGPLGSLVLTPSIPLPKVACSDGWMWQDPGAFIGLENSLGPGVCNATRSLNGITLKSDGSADGATQILFFRTTAGAFERMGSLQNTAGSTFYPGNNTQIEHYDMWAGPRSAYIANAGVGDAFTTKATTESFGFVHVAQAVYPMGSGGVSMTKAVAESYYVPLPTTGSPVFDLTSVTLETKTTGPAGPTWVYTRAVVTGTAKAGFTGLKSSVMIESVPQLYEAGGTDSALMLADGPGRWVSAWMLTIEENRWNGLAWMPWVRHVEIEAQPAPVAWSNAPGSGGATKITNLPSGGRWFFGDPKPAFITSSPWTTSHPGASGNPQGPLTPETPRVKDSFTRADGALHGSLTDSGHTSLAYGSVKTIVSGQAKIAGGAGGWATGLTWDTVAPAVDPTTNSDVVTISFELSEPDPANGNLWVAPIRVAATGIMIMFVQVDATSWFTYTGVPGSLVNFGGLLSLRTPLVANAAPRRIGFTYVRSTGVASLYDNGILVGSGIVPSGSRAQLVGPSVPEIKVGNNSAQTYVLDNLRVTDSGPVPDPGASVFTGKPWTGQLWPRK